MTADLPTDWLTVESIVTLTGAAAAVLSVTNTTWKLFKADPLTVGTLTSLLVVGYSAYASGALSSLGGILVTVVNFCVLFSMAFGIAETLTAFAGGSRAGIMPTSIAAADLTTRKGRPWLRSWV